MHRIVIVFTRLAVISTLFGYLIGGLIGCRSESRPKRTVVVGIQSAPATLDPRYAKDANGMRIGNLLFSSLVKIGPQLTVVGDAAESWSWNKNSITFRLHPQLRFSNGRLLNKKDIEFSFKEYQKQGNPFRSSLQLLQSVEVSEHKNQLSVTLHLKQRSAKLLTADLPMIRLLPRQEILQAPSEFARKPIGTGCFQFQSQKSNTLRLSPNSFHPSCHPNIKAVEFKVIKNAFTLYQKLKKGEIDIVQSEIPLNKVAEFQEQRSDFQVYIVPGLSFTYLLVNHNHPELKQLRVRQALAQAIDRTPIIQYKLEGLAEAATSLLSPRNLFFNADLLPIQHDPKKAKQLIQKPLHLSLITSSSLQAVENGQILTQQLKQVGFDIDLKSYEWGTFFSDVQKGRFELAIMRWVGAIDPDLYRMAFHSNELPPGRNRGAYKNKKLDTLLDQGIIETDFMKRKTIYMKVQKMVFEDLAVIPLWYDKQVYIVHRRVKNFRPPLNGDFSALVHLDILEK